MAALDENPPAEDVATDSQSQLSSKLDTPLNPLTDTADTEKEDGIETPQVDKPVKEEMPVDQYPHGLKLVLLSGASIVAVFLIALDQVSSSHLKTATM